MPFKFITEVADGCSNRPSSRITQRADSITFYLALNVPQQIYITHLSFSVFYVLQYFIHPAGTFAAGAALSATFMIVKTCKRHSMPYNTLIFIKYFKTTGAYH